jgi:hypothetical protein
MRAHRQNVNRKIGRSAETRFPGLAASTAFSAIPLDTKSIESYGLYRFEGTRLASGE